MKYLNLYEFFHIRSDQIIGGNILARCSRPLIPISAARHYTSILPSCRLASIRCSRCRQARFQDRPAALSFAGVRWEEYLISKGRSYRPGILVCTKCQSFPAPERGEMYRYCSLTAEAKIEAECVIEKHLLLFGQKVGRGVICTKLPSTRNHTLLSINLQARVKYYIKAKIFVENIGGPPILCCRIAVPT